MYTIIRQSPVDSKYYYLFTNIGTLLAYGTIIDCINMSHMFYSHQIQYNTPNDSGSTPIQRSIQP